MKKEMKLVKHIIDDSLVSVLRIHNYIIMIVKILCFKE